MVRQASSLAVAAVALALMNGSSLARASPDSYGSPSGYGTPAPPSAQAPAPAATQIVDPPSPDGAAVPPSTGPPPPTPDGMEIEYTDDPSFPFCDEVFPGYQDNGSGQPAQQGQPLSPGEQPIYNSKTGTSTGGNNVAQQSSPAARGTSALPRNARAAVVAATLGACALLL